MSSSADKNNCDKIKIEKNYDLVDQVSAESIELKVNGQENAIIGMGEVKIEKNVDNNETNLESNEYFEETGENPVIKSEKDFNILDTHIAVLVRLENAAKEKRIAEFKEKENIIDNIAYEVVKLNAQQVASTKELESKDALITVLESQINEAQQRQAKELEYKDDLINVLEQQLNEARLGQAKELRTCINQVLQQERQILQRNEKIAELEDNIQNISFQLKNTNTPSRKAKAKAKAKDAVVAHAAKPIAATVALANGANDTVTTAYSANAGVAATTNAKFSDKKTSTISNVVSKDQEAPEVVPEVEVQGLVEERGKAPAGRHVEAPGQRRKRAYKNSPFLKARKKFKMHEARRRALGYPWEDISEHKELISTYFRSNMFLENF